MPLWYFFSICCFANLLSSQIISNHVTFYQCLEWKCLLFSQLPLCWFISGWIRTEASDLYLICSKCEQLITRALKCQHLRFPLFAVSPPRVRISSRWRRLTGRPKPTSALILWRRPLMKPYLKFSPPNVCHWRVNCIPGLQDWRLSSVCGLLPVSSRSHVAAGGGGESPLAAEGNANNFNPSS